MEAMEVRIAAAAMPYQAAQVSRHWSRIAAPDNVIIGA